METKKRTRLTTLNPSGNAKPLERTGQSAHLTRAALSICGLIMIVVLSACSASTNASTPPTAVPATIAPQAATPTVAPTPTATNVPQPTVTSVSQQASANTALDPCQLIGSQDATKLTGVSFGQGQERDTGTGLKSCIYGANTSNILTVDAAQAPDLTTAQTYKEQFLAELQGDAQQASDQGLVITQVPNFADGAVIASTSISSGGITINGSAIAVSKGIYFFGFSDIVVGGGQAPTSTALEAEATTVLGKLP